MKIPQEVLNVISTGEVEGNLFKITGGQLDRKLYVAVNEVLANIGGKWNKKFKGHLFDEDPSDKIDQVLLTGESVNEKKLYQFYETPKELVQRMIEVANIEPHMAVLEPSAGHGVIADAIKETGASVRCCELDPKKVEVLLSKGHIVLAGDFLEQDLQPFDRVVMNPPFTKQQDIDHVMKAFELLKPQGILVAIMSPGFTFRQNNKSIEFKKLVEYCGYWEELPENTFKDSGTGVNTVLVLLNK